MIYKPCYVFRPGALEAIQRSRNIQTDKQLALYIGIEPQHLEKARAGYPVSTEVALRVAALQGDETYLAAWFDLEQPTAA